MVAEQWPTWTVHPSIPAKFDQVCSMRRLFQTPFLQNTYSISHSLSTKQGEKGYVRVSNLAHFGFSLPLEERIMQLLIIQIQPPHLWLTSFPRFALQLFPFIICTTRLTHLHNTSGFNVIR
jgi:hypothetical protein